MVNQEILKQVRGAVSSERAFAHAKYWVETIGNRLDSVPGQRKAAEYAKEFWEKEGIPCEILEFDGYVSVPGEGAVVPEGDVTSLNCAAFGHCVATPKDGLTAPIVYVGAGKREDYSGINANGKIILTDRVGDNSPVQQALIGITHGAIGMLIANRGSDETNVVYCDVAKDQWGNPGPDDMNILPVQIPILSVGYLDGKRLAKDAADGKNVYIYSEPWSGWAKIYLPLAKIEGCGPNKDQFILMSAHYDCWNNGATDNASGDASLLEISRAINQKRNLLDRSVWCCLWPAHESGTMVGSSYFVDHYWQELTRNCVAYFFFDQFGMWLTSEWMVTSSDELKDFHMEIDNAMTEMPKCHAMLKKTGDQSFFGIGIPSIYARNYHSQELREKWGGAAFGYWNHNEHDTLDKIDLEQLQACMEINMMYVMSLATECVLPMDFTENAKKITSHLKELDALNVFSLAKVCSMASTFEKSWNNFYAKKAKLGNQDTIRIFNETLMQLSRILIPMTGSVIGKFGQDDYALPALGHYIPGLTSKVLELQRIESDSDAYKLRYTGAYRESLKVWESLSIATKELAFAEMKLAKAGIDEV